MEWFALIIPIISCVIAYMFFRKKFALWEYPIPTLAVVITILISKACVKTSLVRDTEYWGSLVVKARYYEYWETWVTRTCSYTTTCCCDSKGANCQTTTHYYDCSYCDENGAYWVAYDDAGNSWRINQEYYNFLIKKWSATPQFVELDRDIDNSHGCGKDGDAYEITWNGLIETSEAGVNTHSYTNKVQASHSTFKLPTISKKEAQKLSLYEYPKFYSYYKQKVVLGLDTLYNGSEKERIETKFQYFNGYYGSRNKVKLFLCLFYDKPLSVAHKQQAYWNGGNQNELVICIGLNKQKEIQWVYPYSWTDRKRVLVDCREDIAELKTFKPDSVYLAIEKAITGNLSMYKDFKKDFSYLRVDLPSWAITMIWILAFVITIGTWFWAYTNELDNELITEERKKEIQMYEDLHPQAKKFYPELKPKRKIRRKRY